MPNLVASLLAAAATTAVTSAMPSRFLGHAARNVHEYNHPHPLLAPLAHTEDIGCKGDYATDSKDWSCIRSVTPEEWEEREPALYGFNEADDPQAYPVGTTDDHKYWASDYTLRPGDHRKVQNIARMQDGPPLLKLDMPPALKAALYPWYDTAYKNNMEDEEVVPGGFTNGDKVAMNKVNLDRFQKIRDAVVKEVHPLMEAWCNGDVHHSMTYGVRVYRRDNLLINHVDRKDTHVASAVIQVEQQVDRGWPLEVKLNKTHRVEVYLQPGEMVLYEGAAYQHGRPMRFNGSSFSNIFTHYHPESAMEGHDFDEF